MKVIIQESEGWKRSSTVELTEKGIFLYMYKKGRARKGILITLSGENEITITVPRVNPMKTTKLLDLQLEILEGNEITLDFEQRQKLSKCPKCGSKSIILKNIPQPNHPLKEFRQRPVYQCKDCGYWTDWFDGWHWHPPEKLERKSRGVI